MHRVTGRGYMDVNRISGYLPGKIVFFLMQVGLVACMFKLYVHALVCVCMFKVCMF